MFNKALFKQSCKANGLMWAIITASTCFMLSCVMLISGSGKIGEVKNSIEDTIIEENIESLIKEKSINNYALVDDSLVLFDKQFANEIKSSFLTNYQALVVEGADPTDPTTAASAYQNTCSLTSIASIYQNAINNYATSLETYTVSIDKSYDKDSDFYKQLYNLSILTINPNGRGNDTFETMEKGSSEKIKNGYEVSAFFTVCANDLSYWLTSQEGVNTSAYISGTERSSYRHDLASYTMPIIFSSSFVSEDNINSLVEALKDYGVTREKYDSYGYTYASVKKLSASGIVTFQARYDLEAQNITADKYETTEDYLKALSDLKLSLIKDISKSSLDLLPQDVSDAIEEIGQTDLYSLIVASIFFKMAGLLLPIIYMIMASNNLISSQVDTGSMAYVLSTSVKRNEVTFTQGCYLALSLLAMFACTTITSMVCFSIVNIASTSLTYGKLLLMNLGAFLVLFAMSGINFFTSCTFDRSKHSMSIGGGLSMFFLVCTMLGLFGSPVIPSVVRLDALNYFNYVSIISLFDTVSIIDGTLTFIYKLIILFAIGIIGYIAGSIIFKKKDLPL